MISKSETELITVLPFIVALIQNSVFELKLSMDFVLVFGVRKLSLDMNPPEKLQRETKCQLFVICW